MYPLPSSRWPLGQLSKLNLGRLDIFLRAAFEELGFVLCPQHLPFRTFLPLNPFSTEPQMCAPGCWNPVLVSLSDSRNKRALSARLLS